MEKEALTMVFLKSEGTHHWRLWNTDYKRVLSGVCLQRLFGCHNIDTHDCLGQLREIRRKVARMIFTFGLRSVVSDEQNCSVPSMKCEQDMFPALLKFLSI